LSSMTWTKEQKDAIETRGGNLLVSAAAGSGKTAVLVERINNTLLDSRPPVDIDRLLVVTFTEAAAGEMRQRVGKVLAEKIKAMPDNEHLQHQLLLLPRTHIGTIHSFCGEVIRNYFYMLKLDPGFRVMDANEMSMLRSEVLDNVLEELYEVNKDAAADDPFIYLARTLAGRHGDDRQLEQIVLSLYEFAHSLPRPEAWLNRLAKSLQNAAGFPWEDQYWVEEWREMLRLEMDNWVASLEEAQLLAMSPGGPPQYIEVLTGEREKIKRWQGFINGSFDELRAVVKEGLKWPQLPRVTKGEAEEEIKKRIQDLRNKVKKQIGVLYKDFLSRPAGEILEDFGKVAPLVQALVEVVLAFKKAYQDAKGERAVVDFSDLEHFALAVLASNGEGSPWGDVSPEDPDQELLPSPAALQYQEHFTEVLVDEYQDINGIQEAILGLVSRDDNRFLVGDVKQSIYRFRLADPMVFLQCYRQFKDFDDREGTKPGRRLDLSSNFRSRPDLLDAVNYFFQRLMSRRVAEVDYDERARLNPGLEHPCAALTEKEEPVEFHLLDYSNPQSKGTEREPEKEDLDLLQLEARWVAQRIYSMIITDEYMVYDRDSDSYRRCNWRDIVVLMRSPKGRVGVFLEEFRRLGIPAYADGAGGYFAAPEVQTVLALLQVIDNPRRDIPLAAVLRSAVVGLKAADLATIRLESPESNFYTAVFNFAATGLTAENGAKQKLINFLTHLKEWRDLARRLSPADLLEELYRQTGYIDLVGALPGGAVRQANLRALVDRARHFDGTVYRGLFRFLRFIEQVQEKGGDLDAARSLGENEDVVRLMSIHRSKGLEFPVVIVAGLGRNFNLRDLSGSFLWHRRLGCGPIVTDLSRGVRYPTVLHKVIRHRLRLESLAEEIRLLYVAFTRAEEKLIITGALKKLDRAVEKWRSQVTAMPAEGKLSASLIAGAKGPLDWLGPTLWAHPALTGSHSGVESKEFHGDNWRLILWPSSSLAHLREVSEQENDTVDLTWVDYISQLKPFPEDWMRHREKGYQVLDDEELRRRLFWGYPYAELAGLPSKITVTEWKHKQEETEERNMGSPAEISVIEESISEGQDSLAGLDLPAFYTGARQGGTERGQVVHLVMERLSLDAPLDSSGVQFQLDMMVKQKILRPEQRELVQEEAIVRFFAGSLGQRLLDAFRLGRLRREVPFTRDVDVTELYPNLTGKVAAGESILLQGVIDCLLVEDDGLVVIDYKTDRLTENHLIEVVKRYRVQLELYSRAASAILQQPVKEKYLYFFTLNRAVVV